MGRWSATTRRDVPRAAPTSEVTGQVLDVGCGPGVLTAVLVDRYGAPAVAAIDPSPSFVAATLARLPGDRRPTGRRRGAAVRRRLLRRRTRPAGRALHVRPGGRLPRHGPGDQAGWGRRGLRLGPRRWRLAAVARSGPRRGTSTPRRPSEAELPGTKDGQLATYAHEAGLHDITSSALTVSLRFESYDEWWAPYLLGVGPLGAYVATLDADHVGALKRALPTAPAGGAVRAARGGLERPPGWSARLVESTSGAGPAGRAGVGSPTRRARGETRTLTSAPSSSHSGGSPPTLATSASRRSPADVEQHRRCGRRGR